MERSKLLEILVFKKQILHISDNKKLNQLKNKEIKSLKLLRNRETHSDNDLFLNLYDRAFRHVCLELLSNNFMITNNKPHQTFISILAQYHRKNDLISLVNLRHKIKKNDGDYHKVTDELSCNLLLHILQKYDNQDALICHSLFNDSL